MLKERLQKGENLIGTWCEIPSPLACNIIASAGMDFIIIDMEHGSMDFKVAQEMAMAAEAEGCEAIIRVAKNDESDVLRALDTGASGILVPHVKNIEDRNSAVSFAKFPPKGNRSYNPYIRALGYSAAEANMASVNQKSLLAIMLEDEASLNNLEEIINHPALDVVYLGIYDLAVSMGLGTDIKNAKVADLVVSAIKKITDSGRAAGCMVHSRDEFEYYKKLGATFLVYKVDSSILYDFYKDAKNNFK